MDSKPKKHRQHTKHRTGATSRRSSGKKRSSSSIRASSSFSSVGGGSASRVPIVIQGERSEESIRCSGFIWGLLGVCVLILLGGGHNTYALGFALILPGVALLLRPPEHGFGRWMDIGVIGLLSSFLFAFLPLFYWKTPAWRSAAVDGFGIDLPMSLSVQPWSSFEAYLSAVAGFCWLYAVGSWKVNYEGRRRIYFTVSCLIAVFSVVVVVGNIYDLRYPGARTSEVFSFFPNRNQTSNFIALGGVLAFGYAMEGLRGRKWTHVVGLVASLLALVALVLGVSRAGLLLYFCGIFLWFAFSLRRTVLSLFVKVGVPIVLLIFSFFITSQERAVERVVEAISSPQEWKRDYRGLIFRDTWEMIEDAPLTGVGLGNFSAVFPQYRDLSRNHQDAVHPESDLLWIGAEGGLLAVLFLGILLGAYLMKCRASGSGKSGAYRMIALTCVIMFLVHGLVDVSGHRPGTAYFAAILVVLALPRATGERPSFLTPVLWRSVGSILVLAGGLWLAGAFFSLPTHSALAIDQNFERADEGRLLGELDRAEDALTEIIALRPLNWLGYFQRAQIALSRGGGRSAVEQDFRRARFVEPNIALVAYEEGNAWLPYDPTRTVSAWREALNRYSDSKGPLYDAMLRKAHKDDVLMEEMIKMSKVEPDHRARLILSLKGALLNREIEAELAFDPSLRRFTKELRTKIVTRWIRYGELDRVEAYLDEFGDTLDASWLAYAMLRKGQARDEEAVDILRGALAVPELPEVAVDLSRIDRMARSFFMHGSTGSDLAKGTALLHYYLEEGDFQQALRVVDKLLKDRNPPGALHYWRAEIMYRLEDYSESLYEYELYFKGLNNE